MHKCNNNNNCIGILSITDGLKYYTCSWLFNWFTEFESLIQDIYGNEFHNLMEVGKEL